MDEKKIKKKKKSSIMKKNALKIILNFTCCFLYNGLLVNFPHSKPLNRLQKTLKPWYIVYTVVFHSAWWQELSQESSSVVRQHSGWFDSTDTENIGEILLMSLETVQALYLFPCWPSLASSFSPRTLLSCCISLPPILDHTKWLHHAPLLWLYLVLPMYNCIRGFFCDWP